MEKSRDADRRKKEANRRRRERERERRAAFEARCAVCGGEVTIADRCSDGTYLHLGCAHASSWR